jgi:hypothetical protein
MRSYGLGNPDLDAASAPGRRRLGQRQRRPDHRDDHHRRSSCTGTPTRGDLKLINTALKEMRYSKLVFSRHGEPKVTIFGFARLPPDDPNYRCSPATSPARWPNAGGG